MIETHNDTRLNRNSFAILNFNFYDDKRNVMDYLLDVFRNCLIYSNTVSLDN